MLDIVHRPPVERVNEGVPIRMCVDNECQFILFGSHEVLKCLRFWFRESVWSGKINEAGILVLRLGDSAVSVCSRLKVDHIINLSEVNAEVPVQVHAHFDISQDLKIALASIVHVHVLPLRQYHLFLDPILLNVCYTVNIENWHENVLVFLQEGLVLWVFLHLTKLQKLQHLIYDHRC